MQCTKSVQEGNMSIECCVGLSESEVMLTELNLGL